MFHVLWGDLGGQEALEVLTNSLCSENVGREEARETLIPCPGYCGAREGLGGPGVARRSYNTITVQENGSTDARRSPARNASPWRQALEAMRKMNIQGTLL